MKRFPTAFFLNLVVSYAFAAAPLAKITFEEYIRNAAVSRDVIDRFLRDSGPDWSRFDPQGGYILKNSMMPWGIDQSSTIETTLSNGARTTLLYANRKVRINTYGDSFTESAQVSDGETWQEYLAGHLGEPVRNYGVGGWGVYQAYRRMLREEQTQNGARYLILTICCDDPTRSLLRARWAATYPSLEEERKVGIWFHGNFWANFEMDLGTGQFVEKEQLLSTPKSLYHMTDPQWMADHLRDDLALQLSAYANGQTRDLDRQKVTRLAEILGFPFDWNLPTSKDVDTPSPMQAQTEKLLNRYGQRATVVILDKARSFARQNGKQVLVVLNFTTAFEDQAVRDDQEILDYLGKERFDYVDMYETFRVAFRAAKTSMSFSDFMAQYQVNGAGHLNPLGNHFVAYALKDKLVSMLDPKPIPYQNPAAQRIEFKGYLHGGGYRDGSQGHP